MLLPLYVSVFGVDRNPWHICCHGISGCDSRLFVLLHFYAVI